MDVNDKGKFSEDNFQKALACLGDKFMIKVLIIEKKIINLLKELICLIS